MLSDIDILDEFYPLVKDLPLLAEVSGVLSNRGRPTGSDKEDVVISILANDGAGQIQKAFVNVRVYVSDLKNDVTKDWELNKQRCRKLCELSKPLFTLKGNGWIIRETESSQRVLPSGVQFQDGHTEHFIYNKLYVEFSN